MSNVTIKTSITVHRNIGTKSYSTIKGAVNAIADDISWRIVDKKKNKWRKSGEVADHARWMTARKNAYIKAARRVRPIISRILQK